MTLSRLEDRARNGGPVYLSVVVTARNDDHGGNLLRRMSLFTSSLFEQWRQHNVRAELILVEWNPVPDKPGLKDALSWPIQNSRVTVRLLEVSPEIHGRFRHSDRLPLFQMIAKNVGIRRARGLFVLCTNIDILFSNELMGLLASGRLRTGRMYRAERLDVPAEIPDTGAVEERLEYCRQHALRIHTREGSLNLQTGEYCGFYPKPTWKSRAQELFQDWGLAPVTHRARLHTNACGDFTLMARKHWVDLRGYPEFEMFSFHLDSLLCFAAHHSGVRELVLPDPMRIYHIEHARGSGWTPEADSELKQRIEKIGVEQLDPERFDRWAIQMRRERRGLVFNDVGWGLAHHNLPETIIEGSVGE